MSCFFIFCLSGLYLDAGIGVVDQVPPIPARIIEKFGPMTYYKYDFNYTPNPRGHIAIGHEWNLPRVRTSLEVRHESWLGTTADVGEESVWLNVRILPFKWEPR